MKLNKCKICGMYFGLHLGIEHRIEEMRLEFEHNDMRKDAQDSFELTEDVEKGGLMSYVYSTDRVKLKSAVNMVYGDDIGFLAKHDMTKGDFIPKNYNDD